MCVCVCVPGFNVTSLMLPIIYMLWSIECFDFSILSRNFVLLLFIECFKLLVSQKNNVCGLVGWCGCAGVCILLLLSISLYLSGFSSMFY